MAGQKPGSIVQTWDTTGTLVEEHASVCRHCQKTTRFPSMRKLQEHVDVCRSCMALICLDCAGKPCAPWLRQVEAMEARARWRRQLECV